MAVQNADILPYLLGTGALVMLLLHPLYSWLASRKNLKGMLRGCYLFFVSNLAIFIFLWEVLNLTNATWLGYIFYIWCNVFSFFIVSIFWVVIINLFRGEKATNVFGVAALINNMLPFAVKGTHVVNISSVGGVQGSVKFSGLSAYSSSKGALISLTELLAEEYKNSGIIFNVLALGAVQTKMLEKAFPGYKASCGPKEMAKYIHDFSINTNTVSKGRVILVSDITPSR